MHLQFWGAARSVTGSMHLLHAAGKNVLFDCGLFQGHRIEAFERNRKIPFDTSTVHAMLLSPAHIDHSGNIPNLVKTGFQGNIYTHFATRDLCSIMLMDSAFIQERDVEFVNKKNRKKGFPEVEPLYSEKDAVTSLEQFVGVNYYRWFYISPQIRAFIKNAGHILGSAMIELEIQEDDKKTRIGFTGDLGRKNLPIVKDPDEMADLDALIIESTYGDRVHGSIMEAEKELAKVVNDTYQRGGKVIIPAFAIERTQEIVYTLHRLKVQNLIPSLPVFVDSPLAINATDIFRMHTEVFDEEISQFLKMHEDPFGFGEVKYTRQVEDSMKINDYKGSAIIISASGMCEVGRILHHLNNNIENQKNTILFVGFQAENTLGRKIVEGESEVKIFGEIKKKKAQVVVLNEYSAHADKVELLEFIKQLHQRSNRLKQIFIVHGEESQALPFAREIKELGIPEVYVPARGEKIEINRQS